MRLLYPVSSVASTGDGFDYFYQDNKEHWPIDQNEDGIDAEDRVLWAIKKIKTIVQMHNEE